MLSKIQSNFVGNSDLDIFYQKTSYPNKDKLFVRNKINFKPNSATKN